jgi:alpha-tubulin suppressor-like RCC1 family protein
MGDNLAPLDFGTGRTAKSIATGENFHCVILDNDTVKCWGKNDKGQLGLGNTNNVGPPPAQMGNALLTVDLGAGRTAKEIFAGHRHVCVILDNNFLKCWGDNNNGQLGIGNTNVIGNGSGEMGDALNYTEF